MDGMFNHVKATTVTTLQPRSFLSVTAQASTSSWKRTGSRFSWYFTSLLPFSLANRWRRFFLLLQTKPLRTTDGMIGEYILFQFVLHVLAPPAARIIAKETFSHCAGHLCLPICVCPSVYPERGSRYQFPNHGRALLPL